MLSLTMDLDQQTQLWIERALGEVERDPSLPTNSLVVGTPLPKTSGVVRLKTLEVRLEKHFLSKVDDRKIAHSKQLRLLKEMAIKDELNEELLSFLRSFLEQ